MAGFSPRQKRSLTSHGRGRWVGSEQLGKLAGGFELAATATLKAAALRKVRSGSEPWPLIGLDLKRKIRLNLSQRLILFVVDASDSMGEGTRARISLAKAAILGLLQQAYLLRNRVALISFHDRDAKLLLPPTNSIDLARARLKRLAIGGATPLAAGLEQANRLLLKNRSQNAGQQTSLVLLSDGEANVSLEPGANIRQEVMALGRQLRASGASGLIFDTGPPGSPSPLLMELSQVSGLPCQQRNKIQAGQLLAILSETARATNT